jgi:hypothetical protein
MKDDLPLLFATNILIGTAVAFLVQLVSSKREIIGGYPLNAFFAVIGAFMGSAMPFLFGVSLDTIKNFSFLIEYGFPFAVAAIFAFFFSRILRKW